MSIPGFSVYEVLSFSILVKFFGGGNLIDKEHEANVQGT